MLTAVQESDITIPAEMREQFLDLHRIMITLKNGNISLALEYGPCNPPQLAFADLLEQMGICTS